MDKMIKVAIKNMGFEIKEIKKGTMILELINKDDDNIIAAKVNNEVVSLSYNLKINCNIELLTKNTVEGMEIYRRSLSFLLAKAVSKLYSDKRLVIGQSIGPGYYYEIDGYKVTEKDLEEIEKLMMEDVKANKPINRDNLSYEDALVYLKKNNYMDKYLLLSSLNFPKVAIYICDDFFDIYDGPIAIRTGILNVFKLIKYEPGFILQFPTIDNIKEVAPFRDLKNIFKICSESRESAKVLNVNTVGALNHIILNNKIEDFIMTAESIQAKKIINIADRIKDNKNIKLIAIAGPSSSGKTTFSKRLAIELKTHGLNPLTISLDNYFLSRDKTPLDENGKPDYESIEALNIEKFNEDLVNLLNFKKVRLPIYNFQKGTSTLSDEETFIKENDIIIIEGIHCLNERLTSSVKAENKFKIYVSALTQMNIDDHNRIPTTDNRIIRRIVRDYKFRGHSAQKTIQMWPSVRRGEEKWIFPFQNDADAYFNSAMEYELAVLKPFAEHALIQIKPMDPEYSEASRLLRFLSYFIPVNPASVPSISIIREFIGGSFFKY